MPKVINFQLSQKGDVCHGFNYHANNDLPFVPFLTFELQTYISGKKGTDTVTVMVVLVSYLVSYRWKSLSTSTMMISDM